MNRKLFLLIIILLIGHTLFSQTIITKTIVSNGVNRTFTIYVPAIYNSANPVPILFNFHGYTSNSIQQELYTNFKPIADTANFILVHPQGLLILGSTGWNNFGALNSAPNDIQFVSDMIDTLSAMYNIDQNRVYSTGFSNGSFMSYDLACFLNSRIAAIASVSGSMVNSHLLAITPNMHPTPVLHIHGDADATVSYTGVGGIIPCTHVDSLIKFWVQKNNCNPIPQFTALPDINTTDNCTAEHYVYTGGLNNSTVEFYKIIGGAHTWPGAAIGINVTNQDMNASKEIWRFLSQYRLNNLSVALPQIEQLKPQYTLFPNPTTGVIKLFFNEIYPAQIVFYDVFGNKIANHKIKTTNTEIDLSALPKGLYYYSIQSDRNDNLQGKVMLQ